MQRESDQKIVVFCPLHGNDMPEILHGIHWATQFGRELCLFHPVQSKEEQKKSEQQLTSIARTIIRDLPSLRVSTLVLNGKLSSLIDTFPATYNAVLFIASHSGYNDKLQALKQSTIPFLFVSSADELHAQYRHCILPVDYRPEIKDAAIWASYFGRFNSSNILLLKASDKEATQQNAINQHTQKITSLMNKTGVVSSINKSHCSSWGIQKGALERCLETSNSFLVLLGSRNDSLLDRIIGSPEKRILKRAHGVPVLCVNPRRNIYVMCD